MTTCSSRFILLPLGLRQTIALAIAVAATGLFTTNAHAQTNAASGGNQGTSTNGAAAGNAVENQELFSSSIDDFSPTDGRFTTSRLGTQPTAGGNTNATQQNLLNNARNLQRLNQQFGRANQNRNTGNNQGTRTIRPSLRLGFTPKPRPTEDLRKSLDKQLTALSSRLPQLTDGRSEFASVKFDLARSGVVVISGTVPDDDAARLLGHILRMEPGVYSVQSNLTIASAK